MLLLNSLDKEDFNDLIDIDIDNYNLNIKTPKIYML
jgi:hypothetical protein